MLFNLLESAGQTTAKSGGDWWIWLIILVPLVLLMVYNYFANKKKMEQNAKELEKRNAIEVGFKITTIGGILGTVVEVNHEENWFVLETGSADNPNYIKFDKVAIYTAENPNATDEAEVEDDIVAEDETEDTVDLLDSAEEEVSDEVQNDNE